MSKSMTLRPRVSEKAYGLSQSANVFVFHVPADSNRQTIAKSVEDQFKVSVTAVRVLNQKGKMKRSVRKSGRAVKGQRSDRKFAYVTLKAGDSIPIFAADQEKETKQEKAQKTFDEAAAKTAQKEEQSTPKRFGIGRSAKRTGIRGNK